MKGVLGCASAVVAVLTVLLAYHLQIFLVKKQSKVMSKFNYPNARRDESVIDDYFGTKVCHIWSVQYSLHASTIGLKVLWSRPIFMLVYVCVLRWTVYHRKRAEIEEATIWISVESNEAKKKYVSLISGDALLIRPRAYVFWSLQSMRENVWNLKY